MATQLQNYTSTGDKILHHPDAIADLKAGLNHPIVLHVMPTERCNLKCSFCSVAQRGESGKLHPDLPLYVIREVVEALLPFGLKAVIISGGGEPTLHPRINALIRMLNSLGLQIGIITNGINFNIKMTQVSRSLLSWVRVSANTLDYRENLPLPIIPPSATLGLSYIINPLTTEDTFRRLRGLVEVGLVQGKPIQYIRMLPDCNLESFELEKAHFLLSKKVEELGSPFFHQWKSHKTPPECHLGRVHPVLYTDGNIYPCDSLVLNSPADDKKFHSEFALCRYDKVGEFYKQNITATGSLIDTGKCPHCVFAAQNILLKRIIDGEELPAPAEGITHVNFI